MTASTPCPLDHPLMVAWQAHQATGDFANGKHWAAHPEHLQGSLWALFMEGWMAATKRAGDLHESVNPASDQERHDGSPGAGAMGAVIEYRDLIRDGGPL